MRFVVGALAIGLIVTGCGRKPSIEPQDDQPHQGSLSAEKATRAKTLAVETKHGLHEIFRVLRPESVESIVLKHIIGRLERIEALTSASPAIEWKSNIGPLSYSLQSLRDLRQWLGEALVPAIGTETWPRTLKEAEKSLQEIIQIVKEAR